MEIMDYIIADKYKLSPYKNYQCYDLYEFRDVKSRDTGESKGEQWVHTGKYPSTLTGALKIIYELELKRKKGITEGLEQAIKQAEKIEKKLEKVEVIQ